MQSSAWYTIAASIEQSLDKKKFDTWIRPLKPVDTLDKNNLMLAVQNSFMLDFIEQHYKEKILSFARKKIPLCTSVSFVLHTDVTDEQKQPAVTPASASTTIPITDQKQSCGSSINVKYTFDLFVAGSGNEFAKSVALAVAENPGKTKFNPLLIYGGSGLGKTHLLHAIGNHIINFKKNIIFNFITSEEFYFNFIEAIKNSSTKSYTDTFRTADILLVDDIQFMAGKERTQEEFFYIFNTLYQQGKQIVLTSDVPPNAIKGLHDRLVSRFQWGLCVDIQPPDLETRVAILKKKQSATICAYLKIFSIISQKILKIIFENLRE